MSTPFPYTINVDSTSQHPAVHAKVGRITIVLGANGAGKSALIESLRAHAPTAFGCQNVRKVDARRVMQVIGRSSLQRNQVSENIEQVAHQLLENAAPDLKSQQTVAARLLEALCYRARVRDEQYSRECDELARAGKASMIGPRPLSPLEEFSSLYQSLLPDIRLQFDASAVTLAVSKSSGTTYGPESLSSGEQQIFLLLGKFIFSHSRAVFLVDEPELNLNPRLAERFWSTIEQRHPSCAFVYATHALHFAMRPEVDRTLVLTRDGLVPLDASQEFLDLAREDREQFLGSIPSVVLAHRVLFSEGKADSIDRPLYEYLLQDPSIRVEAIGSCIEVEKAVAGRQGWDTFTRGAHVAGVIDADYKARRDLERMRAQNIFVLPVHEAESILCMPDAVAALSAAMHPEDAQVSTRKVAEAICTRVRSLRLDIAIRRAAEATRLQIAPSLPASDTTALTCDDEALAAFEKAAAAQVAFLQTQDFRASLQAELNAIDEALTRSDMSALMALSPGKILISQICAMLNIRGKAAELLAYYQKHFPDPSLLEPFASIRTELTALFPLNECRGGGA